MRRARQKKVFNFRWQNENVFSTAIFLSFPNFPVNTSYEYETIFEKTRPTEMWNDDEKKKLKHHSFVERETEERNSNY